MYQLSELRNKLRNHDKLPSQRQLAITMIIAFAVLTILSGNYLFLLGSFLFIILFFVAKKFLQILNLRWHQFGLILAWLIQPLILFVFYFLIVTPFAFFAQAFFLQKKSGWITYQKNNPDFRHPY